MMAWAAGLLGPRAAAIGLAAAAVALAGGYILALRGANADLRAETARLERERDALSLRAAAGARAAAALEASLVEARDRAALFDALKSEVRDAPPGDDGPIAPVLARAFDRLRAGAGGDDLSAP